MPSINDLKDNKLLIALLISIPTISLLIYYTNKNNNSDSSDTTPKKLRRNTISYSKTPSYFELGGSSDSVVSVSNNKINKATWATLGLEQPLVIAMVGLPARGKSYIVKLTLRYLKWIGFQCKVFNVGSYRRQFGMAGADAKFFKATNAEGQKVREDLALYVQDIMYEWIKDAEVQDDGPRVAVFDATNTTRSRRNALAQRAKTEQVYLLFVESICDDEKTLQRNYELKLQNDDYKGMDPVKAMNDFLDRVKAYESVYETCEDDEDNGEISYLKLVNVGQKVITRNCHGYLPSQVAFYLQNIHISPRKIFLARIAESAEKGGDRRAGLEVGPITPQGEEFAHGLANYITFAQETEMADFGKGKEVLVLTGTTSIHESSCAGMEAMGFPVHHTLLLNELRGGDFHGMTRDQIKEKFPEEYMKRMEDKLNYRYPGVGGESYRDVIERVRPVIVELERQRRSILVVSHLAVMRCIYAYFMGVPLPEIPVKDFKYHHVYELEPGPFGCSCSVIDPANKEIGTDYSFSVSPGWSPATSSRKFSF